MYVVVPSIRFGHVFPLSVDLLDVEFIDRQHRIAILEAVQDFPHPILQNYPLNFVSHSKHQVVTFHNVKVETKIGTSFAGEVRTVCPNIFAGSTLAGHARNVPAYQQVKYVPGTDIYTVPSILAPGSDPLETQSLAVIVSVTPRVHSLEMGATGKVCAKNSSRACLCQL